MTYNVFSGTLNPTQSVETYFGASLPRLSWKKAIKGTLRRRLSHGYFSFIAKYT